MGKSLSRVQTALRNYPARVLLLGLDAAGKTTILYRLNFKSYIDTLPTAGFNVETFKISKGLAITMWDVGGQEKLRNIWSIYFKGTRAVVFVVDSTDRERLSVARRELWRLCRHRELVGVPVVVVANKQDKRSAMSLSEIADGLGMGQMKDRYWDVQGTCATSGEGLFDVLTSIVFLIRRYRKIKLPRRHSII